jgi:hypothetical protein
MTGTGAGPGTCWIGTLAVSLAGWGVGRRWIVTPQRRDRDGPQPLAERERVHTRVHDDADAKPVPEAVAQVLHHQIDLGPVAIAEVGEIDQALAPGRLLGDLGDDGRLEQCAGKPWITGGPNVAGPAPVR